MTAHRAAREDWLADWLGHLDAAGFHVGVRERLLSQTLLARVAVAGALPREPLAAAGLLRPLLCSNAGQQRRYDEQLAAWWQDRRGDRAPGPRPIPAHRLRAEGAALARRRAAVQRWIWPLLLLLLALASAGAWWRSTQEPPPAAAGVVDAPAVPAVPSGGSKTGKADATAAPARVPGIYVPSGALPLPLAAAGPPAWAGPLRTALLALAALSALALAVAAWRARRRQLALRALQTDEPVDEQVLREPAGRTGPRVAPPPGLLRPASRLLRQRAAGARVELDLRATLRASIDAGGAFVPRTRSLAQTPEYLVLLDSRGPADHLARWQQLVLDALVAQNVACTVFHFEFTPAPGCWRQRADGSRFDRSSLAELGGRFAGQRLLVFADPGIALDPRRGTPLAWAVQLKRDFPAAAWFTPRPVTSWDTAEFAVAESRELGFLVLPLLAQALDTLAGWFASERAHLELPADMAGPWPTLLADDPFALALRHRPPPPETIEQLLRELRQYLGPQRLQWLAACAVFPALSWPLTLGLGEALLAPGADAKAAAEPDPALAAGAPVLGALPWLRYGRMPDWLREALIDRLDPAQEALCRRLIERRLDEALTGAPAGAGADELTRVALRRAWLRAGDGVAQDRVLVDFLSGTDRFSRLVQRLPERLRRWIFRRGRAAYGLRPGWMALPVLGLAVGLVAATSAWEGLLPPGGLPTVPLYSDDALDSTVKGVESLAVTPDGLRLLALERGADDVPRVGWRSALDRKPLDPQLRLGAIVPQAAASYLEGGGVFVLSRSDELEIFLARTGERLKASGGTRPGVQALAFSVDLRTSATLRRDGRVTVVGPLSSVERVAPAASPDGSYVAMALSDAIGTLWLADDRGQLKAWDLVGDRWVSASAAGTGAVTAMAADTSGTWLAVARSDGRLELHDARTGERRVAVQPAGGQPISALAFSPGGQRLLAARGERLLVFGAAAGRRLRVIGCRGSDPRDTAGDWPLLFKPGSGIEAVAYTPDAAFSAGQLPDIGAGEVLFDPADPVQEALAATVVSALRSQPSREPARWRRSPSPGLLAVTAYACRADERIEGSTRLLQSEPEPIPDARNVVPVAPPTLAGLRFEIFGCNPGSSPQTESAIEASLRRLGASSIRKTSITLAEFDKLLDKQFAAYEIRPSVGQPRETAAAALLRNDKAFAALAPWTVVPVRQQSKDYVSVVVCPLRWAALQGAAAPQGGGAATPPAASEAPQSQPQPSPVQQSPVQQSPAQQSPAQAPPPTEAPSAPARRTGGRALVVQGAQLLSDPSFDMSDFPVRTLACGDHWFSAGVTSAAGASSVPAQLQGEQPTLVVNACSTLPPGTMRRLDDALLRRVLDEGKGTGWKWDGVLLSVGLDRLLAALANAKQPLLLDNPRETKGGTDRISAGAFNLLAEQLRIDLRALVLLRDSGVNRGTPILLGTYDYPTPRQAGTGLRNGPWLLPAMLRARVPPDEQAALARELIDRLASTLQSIAADGANFPSVFVVDTRGTLTPAAAGASGESSDWLNEITPSAAGYAKLARRWQAAIARVAPAKGR